MRRGYILFADNDPDFLKTRAEFLQQHYQVLKAHTPEEAEALLRYSRVHVAILDIRMVNDNDDRDLSGLLLAKRESYQPIPKILLTGFPSYKDVREALRPALDGLPPAVEFLAKNEGPQHLLRAVEQAFDKHVQINWDLTINWEQLSLHHLVNLIEPALDSTRLLDRAAELEDLFRKLFYDKTQIAIGRLFAKEPGQVILEVVAFADMGSEAQLVVSCGLRPRIKDEAARYERFAPKDIGIGGTDKEKLVETSHFAATIYTLIGGVPAEMTTFRDFYQSQPVEKIATVLDQLFKITLASWHRKGRFHAEDKPPSELYRDWLELDSDAFTWLKLEQRIEAISRESLSAGLATIDCTPQQLTLQLPDGSSASYRNPAQLQLARNGGVAGVLCGLTHGRVDASTVLVDDKAQTWLVDFAHAGSGPLLRDFVLLEMAIKLELLDTTDVYARYALEQRLLDAADLADTIRSDGLAPELQRALATVERIRQLAATLVGRDLEAYVVGLLFCSLKAIAAYDLELHYSQRRLVPYAHALLLAAMLHEKLLGSVQAQAHLPDQALQSLWIDTMNREVWVEGRLIDLTQQDFNILAYLYNNPGLLHSRQDIMKGALGHEYDSLEESRFNSALSRLRQKIEPDPDSPKYIITRRGHGYKLVLPLTNGDDIQKWSPTTLAQKFFEAAKFQVELVQADTLKVNSSRTREWSDYGSICVRCYEKNMLMSESFRLIQEEVNQLGLSNKLAFVVYDGQIELAAALEMWKLKKGGFIIVPLHTQLMMQALITREPDAGYRQLTSAREIWRLTIDPYDSIDSSTHPQWFVGRNVLLNEIMRYISGSSSKQVALWGMRRVGKTAVLTQIELTCHEKGYPVVKWLCKRETLEAILYNIVNEFLQSVKKLYPQIAPIQTGTWAMYQQNGLTRFKIDLLNLWNTVRRLSNADVSLVLLLDELELGSFFPGEGSSEEDYLRYCSFAQAIKDLLERVDAAGSLSLIIAAEYPWINEINRFPFDQRFQNPLFKRFTTKLLIFLEPLECAEMVQRIGGVAGLQYDPASLRRIYSETRGHPQVTRWLCSCILKVLGQDRIDGRVTIKIVDRAVDFFLRDHGGESYRSYFEEAFWKNTLSPDMDSDQIVLAEIATRDTYPIFDLVPRLLDNLGYSDNEEERRMAEESIEKSTHRLIELSIIRQDRRRKFYRISIPLYARWIQVWKLGW